jgi:DnaJ-class molecular chaperone
MCDECNDTGELRIPRGQGVILMTCYCRYSIVEATANERKTICPDCDGEGREKVPSNGLGKVTQKCRRCGGIGKI